jgi:hypothetical protein
VLTLCVSQELPRRGRPRMPRISRARCLLATALAGPTSTSLVTAAPSPPRLRSGHDLKCCRWSERSLVVMTTLSPILRLQLYPTASNLPRPRDERPRIGTTMDDEWRRVLRLARHGPTQKRGGASAATCGGGGAAPGWAGRRAWARARAPPPSQRATTRKNTNAFHEHVSSRGLHHLAAASCFACPMICCSVGAMAGFASGCSFK